MNRNETSSHDIPGPSLNGSDFYERLSVRPDATADEIKTAYHRLARTCHPDVSSLPDAEERMRKINEAYEVLRDPEQRAAYDGKRLIPEPAPVRRAKEESPVPQSPRSHDPRYEPGRPDPVKARPPNTVVPVAASFWIAFLLLGLLIILLMGAAALHIPDDEPLVTPLPSPAVPAIISVTPTEVVQRTFGEWKQEGDAFREQDRKGDALAAYDRALALRPNASEIWIAEGDIYSRMDSVQKALSSYNRAVIVNASASGEVHERILVLKNLDIWMDRAELLVEQGDYSEAIGIYNTILAPNILSDRNHKRILSAKVYALMREGKVDEAGLVSKEIEGLS